MSDLQERRPVIIAIACAVIAALVLVFGVSCRGGNDAGAKGWQSTFSGAAKGGRLTPQDLEATSDQCKATGAVLHIAGTCVFSIPEFGGRFYLGPPIKSATLVPLEPVIVQVLLEGASIEQAPDAWEEVHLAFGKSGGQLVITCPPLASCDLQLLNAGG